MKRKLTLIVAIFLFISGISNFFSIFQHPEGMEWLYMINVFVLLAAFYLLCMYFFANDSKKLKISNIGIEIKKDEIVNWKNVLEISYAQSEMKLDQGLITILVDHSGTEQIKKEMEINTKNYFKNIHEIIRLANKQNIKVRIDN